MLLPFWSMQKEALLKELQASQEGLSTTEAKKRLARAAPHLLIHKKRWQPLRLFLNQFTNPIILLLISCALFLFFYRDAVDASIILSIVVISGLLGFWQEYGAANTIDKLLSIVQIKASVLRDGSPHDIPMEEVVPGDIVLLNAGDIIPGDGLILELKDFFVDEATLTGEAYPVEKEKGPVAADTPLAQRLNSVFMGTHVISGTAQVLITHIGKETLFGQIAEPFTFRPKETDFEHGIRRFGYFLLEVTFLLVASIFVLNIYFNKPFLEALLFSLAIAVGLTPQLLPAIISINLAHGAKHMAKKSVIVRRLASIENFGSMTVLCADKTGTLTKGVLEVRSSVDVEGKEKEKIGYFAYLNAFFQTGYTNPIDETLIKHFHYDTHSWQKEGEIPYDFFRKRLSVALTQQKERLLITKGSFAQVMEACTNVEDSSGKVMDIGPAKAHLQKQFEELSSKGLRCIAVAYKQLKEKELSRNDEQGLIFLGLLVFFDPIKEGIRETIHALKEHGVLLKIITGDNRFLAKHVAEQLLLSPLHILTGSELARLSDHALLHKVQHVDLFAEVEPNQKERLVLALRKRGHVVGYLGDGINDVSAMYAADVSISVESSVDCAKEVADIVLLKKNLAVLWDGIKMGRITFANTLKYVLMATSANFGNMFSMAGASLFLPFLPLLPKQVLLVNLLTDLPEMAIATDSVDNEMIKKPRKWDVKFIRKFMLTFGLISSVFDYLTFGVLLFLLQASPELFRAGWFLESVISATMIVLVIRTERPFFKSRPSSYLLLATLLVIGFLLLIPITPLTTFFGFTPLPWPFFLALGAILILYVGVTEMAKKLFYNR